MLRRQLLAHLLAFAATNGCSKKPSARQSSEPGRGTQAPTTYDVIVIGAGVSGLSAAKALRESGKRVLILEGRDRIGGRVFTERAANVPPLDCGASWIHGTSGNPIYQFVKKLNLRTDKTAKLEAAMYDARGARLRSSEARRLERQFDAISAKVKAERKRRKANELPDISVRAAFDVHAEGLTANEKLMYAHGIASVIESEYATDASDLSLFEWDRENSFEGGDVVLPDGYDAIPRFLSQGLDVELSTAVESIRWQTNGPATVHASGGREWTASRCIVTLPLGVLKAGDVEFVGPRKKGLPETKVNSLDHFGVGVLNKLYVEFPQIVWPSDVDQIDYLAEGPAFNEILSLAPQTERAILVALNGGKFGLETESWTNEETVSAFMRLMKLLYGDRVPAPLFTKQTRWMADKFARGSYSHLRPGGTKRDYQTLAAPIDDCVFFAGEHTIADHSATVHGAYLSGARAAREVQKSLGG